MEAGLAHTSQGGVAEVVLIPTPEYYLLFQQKINLTICQSPAGLVTILSKISLWTELGTPAVVTRINNGQQYLY